MATKVTRISAKDDGPKTRKEDDEVVTRKVSVKAKERKRKKAVAEKKAKAKEIKNGIFQCAEFKQQRINEKIEERFVKK